MQNHKLSIPYHSQCIEVPDSFWNIRSCGGACIKMILDYQKVEAPSVLEVMKLAESEGGYDMKNGFVHDWAVVFFQKNNLHSYRKETINEEEKEGLLAEMFISIRKENPVMVSVEKRVLEQTKYHLILVVGYEYETLDDMHHIKNVIYHDPESTDKDRGAYRVCDVATFMNYWRGKAIFVSR